MKDAMSGFRMDANRDRECPHCLESRLCREKDVGNEDVFRCRSCGCEFMLPNLKLVLDGEGCVPGAIELALRDSNQVEGPVLFK